MKTEDVKDLKVETPASDASEAEALDVLDALEGVGVGTIEPEETAPIEDDFELPEEEPVEEEAAQEETVSEADITDERESRAVDSIGESAYDKMVSMQNAGAKRGKMVEATGREFAEMFDISDVISIGDRVSYRTKVDDYREKINELKSAYLTKSPLTGRITGLCTTNAGNMGDVYCATVMYGPFKVIIPLPYLLKLDPEVRNSERMRDRDYMRLLINERIGSEIDFIPLEPNEKELIAGGDRLTAMHLQRQAWFLRKRHGRYLLHEGDKVEARVCYTTRATMHIEVFGIELTLRREDVTYQHISSIRDMYQAGDTLPVVIKRLVRTEEVKNGQTSYNIQLEVSAKEAEYDPRPLYLKHMNAGDMHQGVIVVTTSRGFYVKIMGMEMDVFCPRPRDFSALPSNGDEVLLSIAGKDMDKREAYGRIVRVIGRRELM